MKKILLLIIILATISAVQATDCNLENITDCVNTVGCTVYDDGSGCTEYGPYHTTSSHCAFEIITDCINTKGCVVQEDGGNCLVAHPDERADTVAINDFRVEDDKYKFDIQYIYSEMYIDGEEVEFEKGYMGGAAHTWYEVECQEGHILDLRFVNPQGGEITTSAIDITDYECELPILEGAELNDFRLEGGKYKFDAYEIYKDAYVDGEEVEFEKGYIGGAVHTWYEMDCQEGDELLMSTANSLSGQLTQTTLDISEYECGAQFIEGPAINDFRVEDGKYKFDIHYIFDEMFIDQSKVAFEKGYMGGSTHTWYETPCREGNTLWLTFINPSSGDLTQSEKDISRYECEEEEEEMVGDIQYDYIHLHPNMENLLMTDDGYEIYSDVKLRQMGTGTLEDVEIKMTIEELGLEHVQYIDELPTNYGKGTPNQFRIKIPASTKSGRYKVKYYVNDELIKTYSRNIYREGEVKCTDNDGKNYYQQSETHLTLESGEIVRDDEDSCCDSCMTAPSETGKYLSEYYCKDGLVERDIYECPLGCANGKCKGEISVIEEEEPVAVPEPNQEEQKIFVCGACEHEGMCYPIGFRKEQEFCSGEGFEQQKADEEACNNPYECESNLCERNQCGKYCDGCKKDNACLPYGTRTNDEYCSLGKELAQQKGDESGCDNNYECKSNLCLDSQCVEPGLIRKIMQWFKGIFG